MKKHILSFTFVLCSVCSIHFALAELTIQKNTETGQWLFAEDGKPVLQYNYETVPLPDGYLKNFPGNKDYASKYAIPRSNYLHPLFDFDGKPITRDWADDHPHHRGIYWAWPEVGYKGELGDLHALQKVFARPNGNIKTTKENGKIELVAENLWKWNDEEPIVHETATFTVYPLSASGRKIDLEFRFKGLVDEVTLARRGQNAYGGLNFRMAKLDGLKSGEFRESDTAWVFATWTDAATGKTMELTVFEKADNPDYPGEYMHYPNLQFFQPTFPKTGTRFVLKKDETLTLRFQLWLHEATDDAAKKGAWKEFQKK